MPVPAIRAFAVEVRVVASGPIIATMVTVQDEGGWKASVGELGVWFSVRARHPTGPVQRP